MKQKSPLLVGGGFRLLTLAEGRQIIRALFYRIRILYNNRSNSSLKTLPIHPLRSEKNYMELFQPTDYEIFLHQLTPSTAKTYDFVLKKFRAYLEASGGSLERFTRSDVQTYLNSLLNRNMTPSSVAKTFAAIRKWAKHTNQLEAVEEIRIPRPARLSDMPVKSLDRKQRLRLVRDVERSGNLRITRSRLRISSFKRSTPFVVRRRFR